MYLKKSPFSLALIGLLYAAALFTTGWDESATDAAAVEAPESETTEAATSVEKAMKLADEILNESVELQEVAVTEPVVEVSKEAAQPETIEAAPSPQPAEVISEIVKPFH